MPTPVPVEVFRGHYDQADPDFGPLPGLRLGNVLAYEFELPSRFEPWPGRTRVERTFVLLDHGVSFSNPCWQRNTNPNGAVVEIPAEDARSWYVDLITVARDGERYTLRDFYIDVIIPTDGRHYRMLDLEEYGDAMAAGIISTPDAIDGLRRWQAFLDAHLHRARWPAAVWTDFPPAAIEPLRRLPLPSAQSSPGLPSDDS